MTREGRSAKVHLSPLPGKAMTWEGRSAEVHQVLLPGKVMTWKGHIYQVHKYPVTWESDDPKRL